MFLNGCELVRADFHLHTRKDKEFKYTGEENTFVSSYVEALKAQDIHIGVITNHNKFDLQEYKAIRNEAKKNDIFILPGVELSVKEGANGVHTLIVFNPDEWLSGGENYIESVLASAFMGIANRENENTRCIWDIPDTITKLDSLGKDYFIVFAHIEQNSGFVKECAGGLITSLSTKAGFNERVLGFQKLRTRDNVGRLKNWLGYERAFVEGSDPKKIEDIGKGQKTYLKVGNYSFAAVKYALQDYPNRVLSEPQVFHHGYIASASFTGGKLNGITVNFSPELNTLIGIRGSGKSSILEAIRYALDIGESTVDEKYKKELVKSVLGSGGQITLQVFDKFGKAYEIRRIFGEHPSILDNNENDLAISVGSIINNPLYFGQKDLSFTQPGYELDLLQKLVGSKTSETGIDTLQFEAALIESIKSLSDVSAIPAQIKEIEDKNSDLKHKLEVFEEKGVAAKLKKQTSCNSDVSKLDDVSQKLTNLILELRKVLVAYPQDDFNLGEYVSEYNPETFSVVGQIIQKVVALIKEIEDSIIVLEKEKGKLVDAGKELAGKIDDLKEEFAEIKREIQDDTLDPDSFVKYTTDFDNNNKRIGELRKLSKSRDALIGKIKKAIRERNEALQKICQAYQDEISKINNSQSELQIEISFKGDKAQFKELIKANFKGTSISDPKYQQICDAFSDFVAIVEDYYINDGNHLKPILTDSEYAKIAAKIEENYEKLIAIECPNLVRIFYHGKLLEQHSIGQRASALILFILTQKDNDIIIIDQPEDDLDNQVIYKEVIHTIKAKKPDIQFIFATHNANIPVLGDAEQIIATSYSDDNKIAVNVGNIDCPATHKEIVDIMEGGKEAFEKRKLIYTAWG